MSWSFYGSRAGPDPEIGRQLGENMGRQSEITAPSADAVTVRAQYAALCWRERKAGIEVLLITSRDTGRWVLPKGWPMDGFSPEDAAAREAWEEAGVVGTVSPVCLGRYGYFKEMGADAAIPCAVAVFAVRVENLFGKFPEMSERRRAWFPLGEAADLVREPELAALIKNFAPPANGRLPPVSA